MPSQNCPFVLSKIPSAPGQQSLKVRLDNSLRQCLPQPLPFAGRLTSAVLMVRSEPTADASFAAMRERSRLGILPPLFDRLPGVGQGGEPVVVETLVAEMRVEAFNVCVLDWLARSDKVPLHAVLVCPLLHRLADELGSLICSSSMRRYSSPSRAASGADCPSVLAPGIPFTPV